jgi:hypothetical protein
LRVAVLTTSSSGIMTAWARAGEAKPVAVAPTPAASDRLKNRRVIKFLLSFVIPATPVVGLNNEYCCKTPVSNQSRVITREIPPVFV